MMQRCITQFHDPKECSDACFATEKAMKELKALAECIPKNETPEDVRKRIEQENRPLVTYPHIIPHKETPVVPMPPAEEYYPPWRRPRLNSRQLLSGSIETGCSCSKRNGLQDDCKRTGCGVPACLAKPKPLCDPCGIWKKQVTPEEARNLIATLKPPQPPICRPEASCNPDCKMCRGPFEETAMKLAECTKQSSSCKHGEANMTRDFYLLPVHKVDKKQRG